MATSPGSESGGAEMPFIRETTGFPCPAAGNQDNRADRTKKAKSGGNVEDRLIALSLPDVRPDAVKSISEGWTWGSNFLATNASNLSPSLSQNCSQSVANRPDAGGKCRTFVESRHPEIPTQLTYLDSGG
jgi:hypothetical protein